MQQRVSLTGLLLLGLVVGLVLGWSRFGITEARAQNTLNARAQLHYFVNHVSAATGRYSQTTISAEGDARPAQSGSFAFARPGRFKWATETPYEQLVVADGDQVFQYDPDLAQVTVRPLAEAIGTSPAAILFGSGALDDSFEVSELARADDRDALYWLRAVPRASDAGFVQVDIALRNNLPARINLLDAFGQTTRIVLSEVTPAANLPAETFRFIPPEDVDVVRM